MDASLSVVELALRVLMAINQGCTPDDADVVELRGLAPSLSALPPDELACGVITQERTRREERQQASGGGGGVGASEVCGDER